MNDFLSNICSEVKPFADDTSTFKILYGIDTATSILHKNVQVIATVVIFI